MENGVRIPDMPVLASGLTDESFLVGQRIGSGRYKAPQVRDYVLLNNPLGVMEAGAVGDGATDDTAAWRRAFDICRASGRALLVPPGRYLITEPLDPARVSIVGPDCYTREAVDHQARGAVLLHASAGAPLFVPTAAFSCVGMTFYDPLQLGTGTAPVERPPLIQPAAARSFVDWTFQNNVVVNCFDFVVLGADTIAGDWRVTGNRIYAVRYVFTYRGAAPEVMFISDNIFSPGVFQTNAVFGNGAMLAKWTAKNGAIYAINAAGLIVDGLKTSNNIYFCYRRVLYVVAGTLSLPSMTGDQFDGVQIVSEVSNLGAVAGGAITGGVAYCYTYGDPAVNDPAFIFSTPAACNLAINGLVMPFCSGDGIAVGGTGEVFLDASFGSIGPWGMATGRTVDAYALSVNNPLAEVRLNTGRASALYANSLGVLVARANRVTVLGTTFRGTKLPVQVAATIAPGSRVNLIGCGSHLTSGAKSVIIAAAAGVVTATGSAWDKPSDV